MERPDARIIGQKFYIPRFARCHKNSVFGDLGMTSNWKTICANNIKLMTMLMDGVVMHLNIAKTNFNGIAEIYVEGFGGWIALSIHRKKIEFWFLKI